MDQKEEGRRKILRLIGAVFAVVAITLLVIAPLVNRLLEVALAVAIIFLAISGVILLVCPDALEEFRDNPDKEP